MTDARPHPFDLLFATFRAEHFPAIQRALGESDDINRFLLVAPALDLLRELRPDDGLGEGVDDFVALVHAAYLFWRDGEQTQSFDEDRTRQLASDLGLREGMAAPSVETRNARYFQVAPRIVWGQLDVDTSFEPLDGWFAWPMESGAFRMVACFGVHVQRPGVSVVVVQGAFPLMAARTDGSALFAPTMPGGDAAALCAVSTPEELLLLGWHAIVGGKSSAWR